MPRNELVISFFTPDPRVLHPQKSLPMNEGGGAAQVLNHYRERTKFKSPSHWQRLEPHCNGRFYWTSRRVRRPWRSEWSRRAAQRGHETSLPLLLSIIWSTSFYCSHIQKPKHDTISINENHFIHSDFNFTVYGPANWFYGDLSFEEGRSLIGWCGVAPPSQLYLLYELTNLKNDSKSQDSVSRPGRLYNL